MSSPVRVLIADDHPLFRLGLKFALQAQGFEVVAEAETGSQAVEYCRRCPVEVALLDVRMPDGDGIAACQQIVELGLPVVVVMITTFQEPALIESARRAGAKGYLSKETDPAELARVIRQILANPDRDWLPAPKELPKLTPRELCVLQLMKEGLANKQIARRLGLSIETVKEYASAAYRKLDANDRVTALLKAQQLGIL
ncbi:LuxR family transcriptional regulator [Synechococcus sp. 60AY4M2]|uniref:response regulator transcription factor n=1 Tax=unclassified Synechococcus TaxID=2626047 RepID=UPI000C19CBA8|nr:MULTISPECIES: response regulator transcription factor [unclassified Synechococcus]PIK95146.1 LuxR family transcriptional regulator [Synechococcus sp. 60AY4M2]PIK97389.1 LuxR family transcriptional regulator [Synechococcus sp. 63AY4M1]PIL01890.1 LuxR family transcriptional regulator [Synechococcus sp. 65AY640]